MLTKAHPWSGEISSCGRQRPYGRRDTRTHRLCPAIASPAELSFAPTGVQHRTPSSTARQTIRVCPYISCMIMCSPANELAFLRQQTNLRSPSRIQRADFQTKLFWHRHQDSYTRTSNGITGQFFAFLMTERGHPYPQARSRTNS